MVLYFGSVGKRMDRRELLAALGGCIAWPIATRAQLLEGAPRVGYVGLPSNAWDQSLVEAFRQGLRELGLVENRHFTIDVVWVSNEPEISQAISELLHRGAKLLVTVGSSASAAALAPEGLLHCKRGQITIVDPDELRTRAGSLYGVPEEEFDRLFPNPTIAAG